MAKLPSYIKGKLAEWTNNNDDNEKEENLEKETKKKKIQPKVIKISIPSFKKKGKVKNNVNEEEQEFVSPKQETTTKRTSSTNNSKFNISLEDLKTISTALDYFKKFLLKKGQKNRAQEVEDIDERLYHFIMKMEEAKKHKK